MRLLLSVLSVVTVGAQCALAVPVQVTADNVNLRVKPTTRYGTVGQVGVGDVLEAPDGLTQGWVRVAPPASVDLYVFSRLVKDGKVAVRKLLVRGGPGVNYQVVGSLALGADIDIRKDVGQWLAIAPPADCSVWVSSKYLTTAAGSAISNATAVPASTADNSNTTPNAQAVAQGGQSEPRDGRARPENGDDRQAVADTAAKKVEEGIVVPPPFRQSPRPVEYPPSNTRPAVLPAPRPVNEVPAGSQQLPSASVSQRPAEIPRALAGKRFSTTHSQGKTVTYVGSVRKSGWGGFSGPTKFRLVRWDHKGRMVTVCFLLGQEAQLEKLKGHQVQVQGKSYWLNGERYPIVSLAQIVRRK